MDVLYKNIIESYKTTGSVKKTAEELGTYPIKVRRVLITEGMWHSKTSDQIMELLEQNLSVAEIAEKLVISEKNVQSYMPYTRGQYGGENRSDEAIRSEEYRERMQTAAQNQVLKNEPKAKKQDERNLQKRLQEELIAEKERLLKEKETYWHLIEEEMKRIPMAMQLHLELKMEGLEEECLDVLKKYGRMKKAISRDFIVPGNITLHGLNYAIMKAFGWQNSHLHCFTPNEDEFDKMTDCSRVSEWTRQVGMYFRFPSDDYEELYWDDDYEEGMSFKSWLKSKYNGPYYYGGVSENYLPAQAEVEMFRDHYPKIQSMKTDQRDWDVYLESPCNELLERLMLFTVLRTPAEEMDWTKWEIEKEEALCQVERDRKDALRKFVMLQREMDAMISKTEQILAEDPWSDKAKSLMKKLEELDREIEYFVIGNNPEAIPALSEILYQYDYGDGWEVKITCTNAWYDRSIYARDEFGNMLHDKEGFVQEEAIYQDAYGEKLEGEFLEKIKMIEKKEKPVCIAWDGMNLIDDVGGIYGFCEFLEEINGDDPEIKQENLVWARSLGWTGKMSKAENIL